ncbi:ATP-binding protein [Nocardia sp. XZ_19_369]|uniref:ATP-binding protein n=1 Tax=Nocardia sp. XZ_19_369 TaxID=2769487 RepID=UPI0018909038|nr:ATP-binding protein [Nocardia sp. XZ_19_369]
MTTPLVDNLHRDDRGDALDLDLDVITLAQARAQVRELLAALQGELLEDAVQVFDELASNAHRHGQPPRRARVSLRRRRLRIEVDDTGPGRPHPRTPDRAGGRGLILIECLATAWATIRHHGHKTVWAEIELDRSGHRA